MATDHNIRQLVINKMTDEQYDQAVKSADELYLTPDSGSGGSSLPDQTGQAGKFLTTDGSTASWDNVPAGTVTSVRVQATSPVQSSTSTAQSTTLNTTISLANNYGDTKNPYASKAANYVLAAPNGSAGTPSFRALVKADIPLASETAASGGTTTSLVTTGEKYTWNNKQDAISDLSTIRDGASAGATAVQPGDLATVATTGSYNDLSNKPTIPVITDTYSATSSNGMSGKAVASAISNKADKATSLSGYGITDAYTKTEVDGLISSVYKPAGSVAFASLPTLSSNVLGNVYNVTNAFTTTTNFVEGSGKSYPAGTNVVVVEPTSGTYKFDVLSGFVDLSGYVPTSRKINNKALTGDISLTASDVGALPDSTAIPQGTVKSVRVQAGTGLSSSTSTAQTETLNTTISIASGYKLPTTTEWVNKQDALATQTAYTSKGSATKVPQITTNSLGQVTGITEVDITQPTVNNSTITIQKNGTNVDSFTTNAASGKNINITLAKGDVGLGNVDNTSDLNKPISTATQTALDAKQNTISDLGYIRNQVAKVDDKISAIDITDSGDSLPSAANYSVGDTFLNKSDNKLYTIITPAWQLNSNVTVDTGVSVDLATGIASGFHEGGSAPTSYYGINRTSAGPGWSGQVQYNIHFKLTSLPSGSNYYTVMSLQGGSYKLDFILSSNGFYVRYNYSNMGPTSYGDYVELFNYSSWTSNKEYYITIDKYSDNTVNTKLRETSYNGNILSQGETTYSYTCGTNLYYGVRGNYYGTGNAFSIGQIYLADSTGNFLIADGALTWDSGVTLEDNTQYNDTTNEKTIYYNNNILYEDGNGLPDQTGQSGKYLTTDGTTASWATVQAGPKFLSFTNVTASNWVSDSTYTGYSYKCVLTCSGVTSSDYAQVIFGPDQANSGNYASVCLTGTNSVTIYSKVDTSIVIPTIAIMGV